MGAPEGRSCRVTESGAPKSIPQCRGSVVMPVRISSFHHLLLSVSRWSDSPSFRSQHTCQRVLMAQLVALSCVLVVDLKYPLQQDLAPRDRPTQGRSFALHALRGGGKKK